MGIIVSSGGKRFLVQHYPCGYNREDGKRCGVDKITQIERAENQAQRVVEQARAQVVSMVDKADRDAKQRIATAHRAVDMQCEEIYKQTIAGAHAQARKTIDDASARCEEIIACAHTHIDEASARVFDALERR